jgi:hypothetical protein
MRNILINANPRKIKFVRPAALLGSLAPEPEITMVVPKRQYDFYKNHEYLLKFLLFGSLILNLLSTKINFLHLK